MTDRALRLVTPVFALLMLALPAAADAPADRQSKQASPQTRAMAQASRQALPFEDERDFEEHRRGFIAAPDYRVITDAQGREVWNMGA